MSQMGEVVLLGSAWEADIDLRHIELEFSRNEEIDPKIHLYPIPTANQSVVGMSPHMDQRRHLAVFLWDSVKNRSSDLFLFSILF
jgi:hypothetical protein